MIILRTVSGCQGNMMHVYVLYISWIITKTCIYNFKKIHIKILNTNLNLLDKGFVPSGP